MKASAIAVVLSAVLATPTAWAEPNSKRSAAAAYADGQQRYKEGDFLGAAQRFEAAYALDPDPVYLFNAAQGYRFGKACKAAADDYRKFLDKAPDAPNRAKVEHYIEEMDTCIKRADAAMNGEPAPDDPRAATVAPQLVEDPVGAPSAGAAPVDVPARDASGARTKWITYASGAVGALGLVVGIVEHVRVGSLSAEREDLARQVEASGLSYTPEQRAQADDLDRRGRLASDVAIAGYAIGGAALVTSVAFYLISRHDGQEQRHQLAVAPTARGAMIVGGFTF